ncbi:hypothetical protein BOVATA_006360 [Babesia ovata]|uniref:Uncharacterized protein n=1 Tax=Babesia ovata TaxID=189622 RepID=A0A2H6K819_9APIC|nr:uncharacterized protein BOVATA_006360 [Babesia ovata]GBE59143.1 hypothetical protein BOVATA_006360 [Babesia ovata]
MRPPIPHRRDFAHVSVCLVVCLVLLSDILVVLNGGLLVLLVLADQVVHVGLRLRELHLVHALAGVPVKERLAPEHGGELLRHPLEHVLDGGGVADERDSHLQTLGRDVTHARLGVVWDPLHEVRAVLILDHRHLLVDLLGTHAAPEHGAGGEVAAPPGVGRAHHVLGVEHLLRQLGHGERAVLLAAPAGERRETDHEEVEPGEGDEVDSEFPQVRVELSGESQRAGDTRHSGRYEVVEVSVGGRGELERAEANVVQGFVVDNLDLVGVLDQLVHGQGGVVGLNDGVGDLGVLLADLADQQSSHTTSGTTSERVCDLEALEAVASLSLLAYNIKDGVDEFSALCVVSLGPVVSRTGLPEYEVVRPEELPEWSSAHGVHGAGFEVHQNGAGHVATAGSLIVEHVNALQLEVAVAVVRSALQNYKTSSSPKSRQGYDGEDAQCPHWQIRHVPNAL